MEIDYRILKQAIRQVRDASETLIQKDWADSFYGNISMVLDDPDIDLDTIERFPLPEGIENPHFKYIMVTKTTSTMEDLVKDPSSALGLYRIDENDLSLLWGSGPPTSELSSHLMAYSNQKGNAIIHCHMGVIDEISERFPEGPEMPAGCSWIEYIEPGSMELARVTMKALDQSDTVVWKDHGVLSIGSTLNDCINRITGLESFLKGILGK